MGRICHPRQQLCAFRHADIVKMTGYLNASIRRGEEGNISSNKHGMVVIARQLLGLRISETTDLLFTQNYP